MTGKSGLSDWRKDGGKRRRRREVRDEGKEIKLRAYTELHIFVHGAEKGRACYPETDQRDTHAG